MKRNMTDDALVEADRLEEEGRWEEAAILRLGRPEEGDAWTWHGVPGGFVWAGPGYLQVSRWPTPDSAGWWSWREAEGWTHIRQEVAPWPADRLPADLEQFVNAAVRLVLERKFREAR